MVKDLEFKQKKVNHVFHYTRRFDWLQKILLNGFAPSYCLEEINGNKFFIPMVSFCNIPLKDVDNYMHYGKYGIGMSMEWAIRECLSPVIYLHENTPFRGIYDFISDLSFNQFIKKAFHDSFHEVLGQLDNNKYPLGKEEIIELNDFSFRIVQFFKNWKTIYQGNEIITYHEREWRYIPNLNEKKRLIDGKDPEFELYNEKDRIKKPHLPEHSLRINDLSDIKYITIQKENQREEIIKVLCKKFNKNYVEESLVGGRLLILTESQLHDDF
ncbi:abortive infection system antitoxin AbiGi family protein [Flavobacterium rakeshii]|uniref:abortive infection system antitoxin AbiGi family protein n=1 Tax=Flavobacterium rakeshii TaxID=1038845 RepID=UPI002E7C27B0|nr:abortive infection system antitoxin AbiGi family protein [Flavobacterium rakeshii]MEE1900099.1 abortive infection system antitoxin AbiGi family protein [Flavobacterium rakeshii]